MINGLGNADEGDLTHLDTALLIEGVVFTDGNDLKVAAQSSPNMSVKVSPGSCFIKRDVWTANSNALKFWNFINDANVDVTIPTADATNPRYDVVCAKIDTGVSPNTNATNVGSFVIVSGTPAGSPALPSIPNNHIGLYSVYVGATVTVINSGNIADIRPPLSIQLPFGDGGFQLQKSTGAVDGRFYQDASNNVIFESRTSGASIKIDPAGGIWMKYGTGESYVRVGPGAEMSTKTYSPSVSGTATLDLDKYDNFIINAPAGNFTVAVSGGRTNKIFKVTIIQDGTGSRVSTWFSTIRWMDGVSPTNSGANKKDTYVFEKTGSSTYDAYIGGQNL
jgi:hypothetical protein